MNYQTIVEATTFCAGVTVADHFYRRWDAFIDVVLRNTDPDEFLGVIEHFAWRVEMQHR